MAVETRLVRSSDEGWLHQAIACLRAGGLVAFPTDTVYGLGALASDSDAVLRIYQAKGRPAEKSIPVLVAGWPDALTIAAPTPGARRLAETFWPGALTIVLRRRPEVPDAIGPEGTVGVRAPANTVALSLLALTGPLATSSANLSGRPSTTTAAEVLAELAGRVDLIVDGGAATGGVPSTVVDATGEQPSLVREGPITFDRVLAAWNAT